MEYRPDSGSASLRLDVEGPDDCKPRLHLGIGKGRVDLRVELVASASTLGVLCWKSSRENIVSTANFLGR
jgi:hypothetical protein